MSVYQALARLEVENGAGALCTIVHSQGSTPRHTGSKMLVYPDGSIVGTVGGGELESRVIAEARQALGDGKPRLLEYSMADPTRGDPGVCGGHCCCGVVDSVSAFRPRIKEWSVGVMECWRIA